MLKSQEIKEKFINFRTLAKGKLKFHLKHCQTVAKVRPSRQIVIKILIIKILELYQL